MGMQVQFGRARLPSSRDFLPRNRVRVRRSLTLPGGVSPGECVQHSLVWPTVGILYQSFAQRIFSHVLPFLGVALLPSEAVMEGIRLPAAIRVFMQPMELPFPKCYPFLQRKAHLVLRAEEMHMIGHRQIVSHQPRLGGLPGFAQRSMDRVVGEPRSSILRANG